MKYYFVAFSLLMCTSAIAKETDDETLASEANVPHIVQIQSVDLTEVPPEEMDDESLVSEANVPHFVQIQSIPEIDFTGVPPEEIGNVLVAAVKEVNPTLDIKHTEDGAIEMHNFILPPLSEEELASLLSQNS